MKIYAQPNVTVFLGRVGEDRATTVYFDVSEWLTEFGSNGTFSLAVKLFGAVYVVNTADFTLDGKYLKWVVSNSYTAAEEVGECQLTYSVSSGGSVLTKSVIYRVIVCASIDAANPSAPIVPDPGILTEIIQAVSEAQIAAQAAEDSRVSAAESADNAATSYTLTAQSTSTAVQKANEATENSRKAEAWAVGTKDGVAVQPAETQYQNNSKYFANQAQYWASHPPRPGAQGSWEIWDSSSNSYVNTNQPYVLKIVKSYPSIAAMNSDLNNMNDYDLVIIQTEVEQEDNSKLYMKISGSWRYLSDLSGAQGVGVDRVEFLSSSKGGAAGQAGATDTYRVVLTNGNTHSFVVYNGKDGQGDMNSSVYDPTNKGVANGDVYSYAENAAMGRSVTLNLAVANWTGTDAPFSQTLTVPNLRANQNGFISIAHTASVEQREQGRAALLAVDAQAQNSITIIADGEKPTVEIPVTLVLLW